MVYPYREREWTPAEACLKILKEMSFGPVIDVQCIKINYSEFIFNKIRLREMVRSLGYSYNLSIHRVEVRRKHYII